MHHAAVSFAFAFVVSCGTVAPSPAIDEPRSSADPTAPDASSAAVTDVPDASRCTRGTPGDFAETLTVGTLSRTALVHVPSSYDATRAFAVVVDLHGRTLDASSQMSLSGAIAKADAEGFVVVHPEAWGSPTSWNAGGGCCDPASSNDVDDVGFIRSLLDTLEKKLCVDTKRVFVMGLSNGGYLAYRVACELSDRVAAIGSVTGGQSTT